MIYIGALASGSLRGLGDPEEIWPKVRVRGCAWERGLALFSYSFFHLPNVCFTKNELETTDQTQKLLDTNEKLLDTNVWRGPMIQSELGSHTPSCNGLGSAVAE